MATYDREQKRVIRLIKRIGRKRGEQRVKIKANLETGAVETGFRNLNYGDADSLGYRGERQMYYKNPRNLRASINRFYDEADKMYHGQPAGRLAADVQRPAAQYESRYGQHSDEAKRLLKRPIGDRVPRDPVRVKTTTRTGVAPDARKAAALAYLGSSNGTDALLNLASSLKSAVETTHTQTRSPGRQGGPASPGRLGKIEHRANRIDAHHFNYQWGGGHDPSTQHKAIPLDCSGAVSKVLGISPRVSGAFESWGKPGRGKRITIFANGHHVLMEINGRMWGTSASNPGGGAGWIPASAISPEYLKGFVARHPKNL